MNCNDCRKNTEEQQDILQVPYVVYEAECARHDRNVLRLVLTLVLCIVLMVGSNLAWLYVWNQYDYEIVEENIELTTKQGGNANYIGNDGDITNYGNGTSTACPDQP